MKLRMQSNSIRLRLKRTEVENLVKTGRVEESIVFGGEDKALGYALESSVTVSALRATLDENKILVQVPAERVEQWASGDEVGIEEFLPTHGRERLHVLIEKDFACLNGSDEQNTDTFAHPLAETKC